jgi:hypothetical protein
VFTRELNIKWINLVPQDLNESCTVDEKEGGTNKMNLVSYYSKIPNDKSYKKRWVY